MLFLRAAGATAEHNLRNSVETNAQNNTNNGAELNNDRKTKIVNVQFNLHTESAAKFENINIYAKENIKLLIFSSQTYQM